MTRIKICGVTTFDDALAAAQAGADMLGLNFYPPSPRSISLSQAGNIAAQLRDTLSGGCPLLVGIFVNPSADDIFDAIETVGLNLSQLSGDEPVELLAELRGLIVKAIRPRSREEAIRQAETYSPYAPDSDWLPSLILDAYHPDLYGGTGEQASVESALAVKDITPRLMLAGGLTPDNVGERAAAIQPWGVDVASGVEGTAKGKKDHERMQAFIQAVRSI
jgi:phosphoribosylanthranilate isomerase